MNFETLYSELKALQNKAFNLSKADKQLIRDASKDLEIDFFPRPKCDDCFRDQIIILLIDLKKKIVIVENNECIYEMVNNKSIKWGNNLINSETITYELAEEFKKNVKAWASFIKLK